MAWPPAPYDVISRNHSDWPSLNLSQNVRKGWTNSYWKRQVLMLYPLGKNSEKPYGGVASILPPLVRPRVKTLWIWIAASFDIKGSASFSAPIAEETFLQIDTQVWHLTQDYLTINVVECLSKVNKDSVIWKIVNNHLHRRFPVLVKSGVTLPTCDQGVRS